MKAGNTDALTSVDEYYPELKGVESGISSPVLGSQIERIEYYNLQGIRLSAPVEGVNIRRIVYTDGHIETDKVIK